ETVAEPEPTPPTTRNTGRRLTQEDFLYDIDFLMQTLEENFPFAGVAERMTGSYRPFDTLRDNLLLQSYRLNRLTFESRINNGFRNLFDGLAHLAINPDYATTLQSLNLISHARVPHSSRVSFNIPIQFSPRIIEENKIALIPVPPQFFNQGIPDPFIMREVQDFIAKIQGYEHVILDMRHLGGGFLDSSVTTFISPNISEPLIFQEFAFIANGEIARNTYETRLRATRLQRRNTGFLFRSVFDSPLVPAAEFAEQHNLVNMNQDDLQSLAYGFILETTIANAPTGNLRRSLLADNIWLLIGPNNGSAGAIFANIAKEAGFTLVGEQTRHWNSDGRASFALPRTGHVIFMDTFYITDNTGRNIEEFPPEPHYFNRPGMDALQTTLAIIAERAEQQE
ncbi:MAG: S41 family peptidase, partial [Defluviitaleaceae bacterium]|nr:S41 family peptidase [Defluviitaleaceae bacterium]